MTSALNAVAQAIAQLRRNWTRSALTSLGILVGVAAVIAIVGLGRGANASIGADLDSLGNNLLLLESGTGGGPQARTPAPLFREADLETIARQVPHLSAVAAEVQKSTTAVRGGAEWTTVVTGSTSDWLVAGGWTVAEGRAFGLGEQRAGSPVCVVGDTLRTELFGDADPLGTSIRLGAVDCTVIGVLGAKGENLMGMDQDDVVLAPLAFVQRRLVGSTGIERVLISVDDPAHMDRALATLDDVLRDLRHVTSDDTVDYEIRDTRELASTLGGITTVLTALLAAVAAVSLLVGGIGIMNIMLVSVTERTHEIGIRMAIGALESDVMIQFLTEAVVLSAFGGVLGVGVGVLGTAVGAWALGVPFVVSGPAVVTAVSCSAGMGVLFGWVPARRAARLEPIDALRHP